MSSYNALYLLAARHLRWVWFHSTGGCLPALIFMALAICSPPMAVASSPGKGVIPPVHPGAPFTPRVLSLLFGLTVDEKISLVHGDYNPDPASVGQVGYLPGVPRLGIPERRDADALGIEVVAESTAPPARLGLGATFDRGAVYALGQLEGKEGRALGVDLIYAPQVELVRQPNWCSESRSARKRRSH